jgi:hypothetical protein
MTGQSVFSFSLTRGALYSPSTIHKFITINQPKFQATCLGTTVEESLLKGGQSKLGCSY